MRLVILLLVIASAGCQKLPDETHSASQSNKPYTNDYKQYSDGAPARAQYIAYQPVKPKYEPLSRYGNPQSYHVLGRSYEVLKSAKGYKEKGVASWYGTKFHNYRTSSGEMYNMYSMTAAHKTLPLPSYVKVRNLNNGKEAIVRVNDRGPFHQGRIIDLSFAAANKLGLMPKGTAPVLVEAIPVNSGGREPVAKYFVQAGAYNSAQIAQGVRNQIKGLSKMPVLVDHYNNRYIVKAGPFADKRQTEQYKMLLAKHGVKGAFTVLNSV